MRVRVAVVAWLVVAMGACSLVRSYDGYGDEYGREDASFDDVPLQPDVVADTPPPIEDVRDAGQDADADARPSVSCTLTVLAKHGGSASADHGFIYGMGVGPAAFFLAAGSRSADAGGNKDAGLVLRVNKVPPYDKKVLLEGQPFVNSCAAHDGGAVCAIGTRLVYFEPSGISRTVFDTVTDPVDDLVGAQDDLYFTTRFNRDAGAVWRIEANADAAVTPVTQVVGFPYRLQVDDTHVLVGRATPANSFVSRYDRTSWGGPDAALTGCEMIQDLGYHLALTQDTIFWIDSRRKMKRLPRANCNANTAQVAVGDWFGLAADERFVFVRGATEVRLLWADDLEPACIVPLGDASVSAPTLTGTETAVFEGDAVYFVAPPTLAKLELKLE